MLLIAKMSVVVLYFVREDMRRIVKMSDVVLYFVVKMKEHAGEEQQKTSLLLDNLLLYISP